MASFPIYLGLARHTKRSWTRMGGLFPALTLARERPGFLQVPRWIRRSRCTEVPERSTAIVFQAVRLPRRNEHAVARPDPLRLAAHGHQASAFEDEVDLLGPMAVEPLLTTRL